MGAGQQKKALQMFTSRKVVNVKTLVDGQVVCVKGTMQRPTVIMFENGIPSKAHCSCPLGLGNCGIQESVAVYEHYVSS